MDNQRVILKEYFKNSSFVQSNIESFNQFIKEELQKIVHENKVVEPTIIPQNIDKFEIHLDKVWVTKPEITEADGSRREIYPMEARLRKISYAAPIFLEISAHINDVPRETFTTQIGNLPIMLKSEFCHLNKLPREELISKGEDPDDEGGYFIVNGTEKALMQMEELHANNFLVEKAKTGTSAYVGKLFSEKGNLKVLHNMEKLKDGIHYITFTRCPRAPLIAVIKALGMVKDEEIMNSVSSKEHFDDVLVNLFEYVDLKTEEDAMDFIAKKIGITQSKEIRLERMNEIMDRYLLPHIGSTPESRMAKAQNLCKMLRKFILISTQRIPQDDKDHYMNKRVKLSGDLLADLFRVNLRILIGDLLYNFQRIVKRGKFPTIKVIIREKLLTQRIYSAMATGSWVGARKGVSQRLERTNYLATLSHLQRVVSPLSAAQENFAARELHPTQLGRICPSETPEGTVIGLRKNLALMSSITDTEDDVEIMNQLKNLGLKSTI